MHCNSLNSWLSFIPLKTRMNTPQSHVIYFYNTRTAWCVKWTVVWVVIITVNSLIDSTCVIWQILILTASIYNVWCSSTSIANSSGLPVFNQSLSWIILGIFSILLLARLLLSRNAFENYERVYSFWIFY